MSGGKLEERSVPATLLVSAVGDPAIDPGYSPATGYTLRQALTAAHYGDTIQFKLPAYSTINLSSPLSLDGGRLGYLRHQAADHRRQHRPRVDDLRQRPLLVTEYHRRLPSVRGRGVHQRPELHPREQFRQRWRAVHRPQRMWI